MQGVVVVVDVMSMVLVQTVVVLVKVVRV